MNVTLTSLEALILKATHESLPCPDSAALEAFCAIMRDSTDGPVLAAQALAARIHTPNAREALLALTMLDRCMRRCDANFNAEVGKFRFLNEMIKLVSPKYLADRTAPEVRTRVLQLLHAWSIEFPKETKFKVAYDMLKNQGVIKETPPPLPPEDGVPLRNRAKNAIFEDEEKSKLLQKLLQSKKTEDLQHANRLIKTMVKEEERRNEANSRRAQEVTAALDSAGLLQDMLEQAAEASSDEEQLIHELYLNCTRLRPVLQRLAASDTQSESLSDILHASDVLDEVFEKYNSFVTKKKEKTKPSIEIKVKQNVTSNDSLLDFAGIMQPGDGNTAIKENSDKNTLDELGDIFASETKPKNIVEPLKPVSLMPSEADLTGQKREKAEGWNELDSLGEQLLKQSLPDNVKRVDSFSSKSKKIPMNALSSPKHEAAPINNGAVFDLDFFTKPEKPIQEEVKVLKTPIVTPTDDIMVDISTATGPKKLINDSQDIDILNLGTDDKVKRVISKENDVKEDKSDDIAKVVRPLTDINVTIQSVHPSKVPPLTAFEEDDGVTVVLHFCKDKPRPDVYVIVISTTSKSSSPIEDYKFQSVVPKGCKVRLLPASGRSLPPYNPFLPPPALTQVMLIAKPPSYAKISLKFVITYICDDDMCSEMGELKELPLEEI